MSDRVIALFLDRGGFDHWWDGIAAEDKSDIHNELRDLLGEPHLEPPDHD